MARESTNPVLKGTGFHHVALRARDFEKSLAFYTQGLGFRVAHTWGEGTGRAALLDLGDGNYLELFAAKPEQIPPDGAAGVGWPFIHFAVRSNDVDADIERVRSLGAKITVEPKSVDVGDPPITFRVGFFLGPDGEVWEFFHSEPL